MHFHFNNKRVRNLFCPFKFITIVFCYWPLCPLKVTMWCFGTFTETTEAIVFIELKLW